MTARKPLLEADAFERMTSFRSLRAAALRAARGKRKGLSAATFLADLETECLRLERELRNGSWRPGPYVAFEIQEPKRRMRFRRGLSRPRGASRALRNDRADFRTWLHFRIPMRTVRARGPTRRSTATSVFRAPRRTFCAATSSAIFPPSITRSSNATCEGEYRNRVCSRSPMRSSTAPTRKSRSKSSSPATICLRRSRGVGDCRSGI